MSAGRTARDPRFAAATVALVAVALLLSISFSSDSTSAATGPKAVRGYAYDLAWNPVPNANITVKMYNGAVLVSTLYMDATGSDGYYSVTFAPEAWNVGYAIELTARYGIYTDVNSTTANNLPFQWLNASLGFEIPELGDGITAGLTIASLAAIVAVAMARRRRGL